MNLLNINFEELYRRHLCRHSQFGLNVAHLLTMLPVYLSIYALAQLLFQSPWAPSAIALLHLLLIAINVPFRVFAACVVVLVSLLGICWSLPATPFWLYLIAIVVCHKLQVWSHKFYDKSYDMSEFNRKYHKGVLLFVLLTIYELPILLNYLVFDRAFVKAKRENWVP